MRSLALRIFWLRGTFRSSSASSSSKHSLFRACTHSSAFALDLLEPKVRVVEDGFPLGFAGVAPDQSTKKQIQVFIAAAGYRQAPETTKRLATRIVKRLLLRGLFGGGFVAGAVWLLPHGLRLRESVDADLLKDLLGSFGGDRPDEYREDAAALGQIVEHSFSRSA